MQGKPTPYSTFSGQVRLMRQWSHSTLGPRCGRSKSRTGQDFRAQVRSNTKTQPYFSRITSSKLSLQMSTEVLGNWNSSVSSLKQFLRLERGKSDRNATLFRSNWQCFHSKSHEAPNIGCKVAEKTNMSLSVQRNICH